MAPLGGRAKRGRVYGIHPQLEAPMIVTQGRAVTGSAETAFGLQGPHPKRSPRAKSACAVNFVEFDKSTKRN